MSWVLVAWDGQIPRDPADAARIFADLEVDVPDDAPPTQRIRDYAAELLARWPDGAEPGGEHSRWSDGPLINNANGRLFVFGLALSSLDRSIPFCSAVARRHGIVLFDQQQDEVYSPAGVATITADVPAPELDRRMPWWRRRR